MDPVIPPISSAAVGADAPQSPAADSDLTGQVLGDYRILRSLGQGGMGQVFLAEQISLKRKVALKLLRAELAGNATSLQRFKAEAEAVARATHANIVQVYAIGEHNGLHFMALEYVEGRNLREYVEKKGPPELFVALSIMRQVGAALQRASELGIIHRDIKPENILLTRKGEAKVADFGLSRCFVDDPKSLSLTQSVVMGTPLYMSPEQVEGKPVDPRTDIYSFGVTCYFMFAGHPPFQGNTAYAVALHHLTTSPPPLAEVRPDLAPEVCAMVHKMMAKLPEQRYQTGREIVKDVAQLRDALMGVKSGQLSRLMRAASVPVTGAEFPTAMLAPGRRLRWAALATVMLALLLGALAGWVRSPPRATATGPDTKAGDGPGQVPVAPLHQDREKLLRTEWARYLNPGAEREKVVSGLKYAVELALLYLDDHKLDDAEEWFREVEKDGNHPAYHLLGKLGRAIVPAFKDRYKESNFIFEAIWLGVHKRGPNKISESERRWFNYLITFNRHFRRVLASALDHNYDNNSKTFPAALEPLRHPPSSVPKARGKGSQP